MSSALSNISNQTFPRLSKPILKKRKTQLRADQGYGIGRTALINSWKITTPGIVAKITINNITISSPDEEQQSFSATELRNKLREALPFTPEETELVRIDSSVYSSQLQATEHYRYFPVDFLFNLIFTGDLCITFKLRSESGEEIPEKVNLEEEYVLSEIQLIQQLQRGKSIEEIQEQKEDASFSADL
jgi:hypothetical protein